MRRASKSDFKALSVVRDLSERKKHTFSSFIKICLAEVGTIENASLRIFQAMLGGAHREIAINRIVSAF